MQLFTNNATSSLASAITALDTTILINPAHAGLFPNPTGGDYFKLTLEDVNGNKEIVKCTARSSNSLTVVRAQESTIAAAFAANSVVELRVTSGAMGEILQGISNAQDAADSAATAADTAQTAANNAAAAASAANNAATAAQNTANNAQSKVTNAVISAVGGTANAITCTATPAVAAAALTGMVRFQAANTNTGAVTFATQTGAAVNVLNLDGQPLTAGSIVAGTWYAMTVIDGNMVVYDPSTQTQYYLGFTGGNNNAYTLTIPSSAAKIFSFKPHITCVGNPSLNARSLRFANGSVLKTGDLRINIIYTVIDDGANYTLLSESRALGDLGSEWVSHSGTRVLGTAYTNGTGGPICVHVKATITGATGFLRALILNTPGTISTTLEGASAAAGTPVVLSVIVPPWNTYTISNSAGTAAINAWAELTPL